MPKHKISKYNSREPSKWQVFYGENKRLIWGCVIVLVVALIIIVIVSVESNKTTPSTNPTNQIPTNTPKKQTGEPCSVDRDCTIDNICAGGVCLPDLGIPNINNARYNLKFKNLNTGQYLCLKPGVTRDLAYASDGSNANECVWRTKINGNGELQIIRNLNNNSIGPRLQAYIGYSSDNKSLDTKWNYIDDSKVLKNNYYSTDYPVGVQSNIDAYTGGCLSNINTDVIKAGTAMCSNANNKWVPEYVSESNCSTNSECPSGKCVNNICLSKDGEWCNVPESCASGTCTDLKCGTPAPATNTLKDGSTITLKSQLYNIFLNYCDNLENDSCKGYLARVGDFDSYRSYWTIKKVTDNGKSEINYGESIYLYQFIADKSDKHYLSACGSTSKPVSGYWVVSSPRTDLSTQWRIQSSAGESGVIKSLSNVFLQNSYDWNTRLGMFSGGTGSGSEWCDGWNALTSLNFNDRDETKWTVALK